MACLYNLKQTYYVISKKNSSRLNRWEQEKAFLPNWTMSWEHHEMSACSIFTGALKGLGISQGLSGYVREYTL